MSAPKRRFRVFLACCVVSVHVAAPAAAAVDSFTDTTVVTGLNIPTAMEFAPDGRLFVAEKGGSLRVVKNGSLLTAPFVALTVETASERGLLGVAFDPNFSTNRFVYLYYTRAAAPIKNRVSRFRASATNPDVVEPGSEVVILDDIASDAGNHNGGATHFGIDGKLYIGVGDGGTTHTNSQSLTTLSGKLLRINPDGTIPSNNPFVSTAGARGEIWAMGLRNPYTFGVDPVSGKIHINDVGENTYEEINAGAAGANYGWPTCEGPQETGVGACTSTAFTYPIASYTHAVGRAITGGAFYRGNSFPGMYTGVYFFSDYLGGFIKYLDASNHVADFRTASGPVDLKVGPDGALYYASITTGAIISISYAGAPGSACDLNQDGTTNIVDVQGMVNQAIGVTPCSADINKDGACNIIDVQRIVNAALGGACVSP